MNQFKCNSNQKQYIKLSTYAISTIKDDMLMFSDKDTLTTFINLILERFILEADASISLRLSERSFEIEQLINRSNALLNIDSQAKESIKSELLSEYQQQLSERQFDENGEKIFFRLSNDNYKYIYGDNPLCPESTYYRRAGDYIRAIIEEYARKPFYEREYIIFKGNILKLTGAVKSKQLLLITTQNQKFIVKPYKIIFDQQHRYRYLVGISQKYGNNNSESVIASFRISRITNIDFRKYYSGKITANEKFLIEKKLQENGVMYLLGNAEKIKIKMGDEGKIIYKKKLTQRPNIQPTDNPEIFTCKITPAQAYNYFFDYGNAVEILSPIELREMFIQGYKDAIDLYSAKNQ